MNYPDAVEVSLPEPSNSELLAAIIKLSDKVNALQDTINRIEQEAKDMTSPEKMMELAGTFLGGGLTP